jgi:hypothetical protein
LLTLGRYGDFLFFADCEAAISWAAREGEDSLQPTDPPLW